MMLWRGLRPATMLQALAALLDRPRPSSDRASPPPDSRARPAPAAAPPSPRDEAAR